MQVRRILHFRRENKDGRYHQRRLGRTKRRRPHPRTPIPLTGRAVHSFLPPADTAPTVLLREKLCGAIRGERLSDRISADGVGRRGLFLKGRLPSRSQDCCPLRKRTERERSAVVWRTSTSMRSRRPGPGISVVDRTHGSFVPQHPFFSLLSVPASLTPGLSSAIQRARFSG